MNARLDVTFANWGYITPLLTPPTTETEYLALVESLDAVLEAGGADESHPLAGLAAMLGDLIAAYEQAHHPKPSAMSGVDGLLQACFLAASFGVPWMLLAG